MAKKYNLQKSVIGFTLFIVIIGIVITVSIAFFVGSQMTEKTGSGSFIPESLAPEDADAMLVYDRFTMGSINLYYPRYIAETESWELRGTYTGNTNAQLEYNWKWDVCGKKFQQVTGSETKKKFKFNKPGNCKISLEVFPITPGNDTIQVLVHDLSIYEVVDETQLTITGPNTAKVGETFWLKSKGDDSVTPTSIFRDWNWKASGACKGNMNSSARDAEVGEKGDKKGKCTMTLTLRAFGSGKAVLREGEKVVTIK